MVTYDRIRSYVVIKNKIKNNRLRKLKIYRCISDEKDRYKNKMQFQLSKRFFLINTVTKNDISSDHNDHDIE